MRSTNNLLVMLICLMVIGVIQNQVGQNAGAQQVQDRLARKESKALAQAAEKAYTASAAAFDAGLTPLESVCVWSMRWRDSLATTDAAEMHLQRMQQLQARVVALYESGSPGGRAELFHTTNYYVAEAKLLIEK